MNCFNIESDRSTYVHNKVSTIKVEKYPTTDHIYTKLYRWRSASLNVRNNSCVWCKVTVSIPGIDNR